MGNSPYGCPFIILLITYVTFRLKDLILQNILGGQIGSQFLHKKREVIVATSSL